MLFRRLIIAICAAFGAVSLNLPAATFVNHYSPHNSERPRRRDTYFIILHTTEGSARGSLKKVWANGECHYFVDTDGKIYRVVSRDRVAFHCGRSMWAGRTGIDDYSIGVEVVGYYNKGITAAQYNAVRELVSALQKIYKVPDEKVLTHSMVAYGAPNRWHPKSHRGRKRCGMLFARDTVRYKLGLTKKPAFDPDVKAGRLVTADPYLAKVLYSREKIPVQLIKSAGTEGAVISRSQSAWDIARDRYNSSDTLYIFPDGTKKAGNEIRNWKSIPAGTKVTVKNSADNSAEGVQEIGRNAFARDIAGDEYNRKTTFYFFSDGSYKPGDKLTAKDFTNMPAGTRVLVGYVYGGRVTAKKSAYDICGKRWNFPSTHYLLSNGTLKAGSEINERQIPRNANIFYQQ